MIKQTINNFQTSLFLGLLLLSTNSIYGQVNLSNGLVGYFPLSGNTDDLSPTNIDGISYNTTLSTGIENNANTAYHFNGTNAYVNCSSDNRDIIDTLSISVWIKTTSNSYEWIVGKYDWTIDRGFALAVDANNLVSFLGRDNGGVYISTNSTTIVNDGNWHHVVGQIYGNTWKLWVDCNLEDSTITNATNPNLTNNEPLTIGNFHMGEANGNHNYFNGSIDEVRIYNRALSANERDVLCNNILGVSNLSYDESIISVHPNPSENYIYISSLRQLEKYRIFNASGVKIASGITSNKEKINIQNLTNGIYIITLESGQTLKFIKSKGL